MKGTEVLKVCKDCIVNATKWGGCKVKESYAKQVAKENERQRLCMIQQGEYLKAQLTPHISRILSKSMYFPDRNKVQISHFIRIAPNGFWNGIIEVPVEKKYVWTSYRILDSLNKSKEVYFHSMQLEMNSEIRELELKASMPDTNIAHFQVAKNQIIAAYAILQHQLIFERVEYLDETENFIKIFFTFR